MKVSGFHGVVELPQMYGWDPQLGDTIVRRWKGPGALIAPPSVPTTLAATLKAAGVRFQVEEAEPGQHHILSATYSAEATQDANSPTSYRWFMKTNDLEKDIWEHPVIVAEIVKTFTDGIILGVPVPAQERAQAGLQAIADIKDLVAGQKVNAEDGSPVGLGDAIAASGLAGMDATVVWKFVQDLLQGTKIFQVDQHVLKHTMIVPTSTAIQARPATDTSIGKMLTRATLINTDHAPETVPGFGPLPATGFWWKRRPESDPDTPGPDKWTVTQEYWHVDAFSTLLFGNPI
jgi:hypothetical protein